MPIQMTSQALAHLRVLMDQQKAHGVRLRLRTRGCSGLSYVMEYVDEPSAQDRQVPLENEPFAFYVHAPALMFLVGTQMDYQQTPTRSGFIFVNPLEKGRCGCQASFHV
jgi:iron-sulfur cluster assembly protein